MKKGRKTKQDADNFTKQVNNWSITTGCVIKGNRLEHKSNDELMGEGVDFGDEIKRHILGSQNPAEEMTYMYEALQISERSRIKITSVEDLIDKARALNKRLSKTIIEPSNKLIKV